MGWCWVSFLHPLPGLVQGFYRLNRVQEGQSSGKEQGKGSSLLSELGGRGGQGEFGVQQNNHHMQIKENLIVALPPLPP